MKETKLFELVTGTEMKPWLSRNMSPNINTCENGWSNFSANLRVMSLNLLELTQFAWQNRSFYFNFLCAVPRDDVIESTRFLMRPLVIIPPWVRPFVHNINSVHRLLYKSKVHGKSLIWFYQNGSQHRTKLKLIDRFGDKNQVTSNDFNVRILTFSGK